jgi:uncharacterized protein (DUF849 family)
MRSSRKREKIMKSAADKNMTSTEKMQAIKNHLRELNDLRNLRTCAEMLTTNDANETLTTDQAIDVIMRRIVDYQNKQYIEKMRNK